MPTQEEAHLFAAEWLDAWNRHDLDSIMHHYAEDIEFISPFAVKLLGVADGKVTGKQALRDYFAKGLAAYPDLAFHPHKVLAGVASVTIYYESVNNLMAAEVMELNRQGLVRRVLAHYAAV